MIVEDGFTIEMSGPEKPRHPIRNRSGFRYWITKATEPPAPLTRVAYRLLDSQAILRRIGAAEQARLQADTKDERSEAEFALQELRAVLQERR